ncbi:MAG: threonine synthase [Deltaproteobacteria bacterium]|nr:threonine synthase [Deltaproteobacteria bacterium]
METKYKLTCVDCGKVYQSDEVEYVCPLCSSTQRPLTPTQGILRVDYDYAALRNTFSATLKKNLMRGHGRYLALLPLNDVSSLPPLDVGPTPLCEVLRLRQATGLNKLFVKNDTTLPTGSFKDRASSIVVAKAKELKKKVITTASTGNAATALAGMAASVGMGTVIFVPHNAPQAKLAQIAMFGAKLVVVKGTYDEAFELSKQSTEKYGWYNRNTGFNPYTIEGKKTAALEIWEQLGYKAPDKVFIPTGDGVILTGTYKGFYDLKKLGLIKKIPQIIPVQAVGSAAIVNALKSGRDQIVPLKKSQTIADSISVMAPACGNWALSIVRDTLGFGLTVTDKEILTAIKELAGLTGIFAEPAAATAYAGLKKAQRFHKIKRDETVVVLITGTGLKDIPTAMKAITIPAAVEVKICSERVVW